MAEHTVVWVDDFLLTGGQGAMVVPNATAVINDYARQGWEVVSLTPGTNAQTHGGLFVLFRRG